MLFNSVYHAGQFRWFFNNLEEIYRALNIFGDRRSKRLYIYLIAYRLCGFHSVRIPVGFSEESEEYRAFCENENCTPSEIKLDGAFGGIKHYDFHYEGVRYLADCLGLKYYLHRKQYFYENEGTCISPKLGDHVIDGGACLGDTAIVFGNVVGEKGRVYCFDPIWEHLQVLRYNAEQNPNLNLKIMPYGISNFDYECEPLRLMEYSPGFSAVGGEIPMRAIDSLVMEGEIDKVDYIKLDIEGSELPALMGASGTIRKYKPKLGISVYHKFDDIFSIPSFINKNFPYYSIYLDHYTIHTEETVVYCSV